MNNLRLIVVWLYLICLVCGLIVASLATYDFWHKTVTGDGARFAIYQDASIGALALVNTLAFAFVLSRRGSNLLAPLPYLAVSATQSLYAAMYAISFDKSGIEPQELSRLALDAGIVLAASTAGLAWNWFMSSWRGLEGGLVYYWTQRFHLKKASAA